MKPSTITQKPCVILSPAPNHLFHPACIAGLPTPATLDSLVSMNMLSTACSSSSAPHVPGFFPAFGWAQRSPARMGCPLGPLSPSRYSLCPTVLLISLHLSWSVSSCFLNCFSSLCPACLKHVCLIPSCTSQDTWHTDVPHLLKGKLIYRSYLYLSSTCDDHS